MEYSILVMDYSVYVMEYSVLEMEYSIFKMDKRSPFGLPKLDFAQVDNYT